jgi:DNA-binding HxlR family transcriptional regulator
MRGSAAVDIDNLLLLKKEQERIASENEAQGDGERMPSTPRPGAPVRGSRTGRPVMALLDLLGRRWALRIIWELRDEPRTFRALQARCEGMSASVLNQRLRELAEAQITESTAGGYRLTTEGRRLLAAYRPLEAWAERWARRGR